MDNYDKEWGIELEEEEPTPDYLIGYEDPKDQWTGYYAVIPAPVRYHPKIDPMARLLFAEITSLSDENANSWEDLKYFSKLYSVSTKDIKKWINQLKKQKFIKITSETTETGKRNKITLVVK